MNERRLRPSTAVLITADVLVLLRFAPHWTTLARDLEAPREWVSRVGVDAAAITVTKALLWLAACWMALGLLALLASVLPGRIGRLGAQVTDRALPAAMRRMVVGAAGVSLVLGPLPALAEGSSSPAPPTAAISIVAPAVGWPADHATPQLTPSISPSAPVPRLNWPSTPPAAGKPPTQTSRPVAPIRSPRSSPRPSPSTPDTTEPPAIVVTVKPGESLWLIAAHRLGPSATDAQIAAEWPRWYAANRTVVGANPALLQPGQQLTIPGPSAPSARDN